MSMKNTLLNIHHVRGMLDARECYFLNRLAQKVASEWGKECMLCEIGSFCGKSTISIAQALVKQDAGVLYAVDWHEGSPSFPDFGTEKYQSTYHELIKNLERFKVEKRVRVVKKRSEEAMQDVPDGLHFLWIDGLHSYDGVKADFNNYEHKLIRGGFLLFHDACWTEWQEPFRLIKNEVLPNAEYNFYAMVGNTLVFRREKNTLSKFKRDVLCGLCEFVSGINRPLHKKAVSFVLFRLTTFYTIFFHNWRR
jgi:predicted O-methyltransferase YrrM